MSVPVLTLGTVEYVPIEITDLLEHLTTLDGSDLRFDLEKAGDDGGPIITNAACGNEGLTALPLIDTSGIDFEEGDYNIFIWFVASPELLRKGPFPIRVDD